MDDFPTKVLVQVHGGMSGGYSPAFRHRRHSWAYTFSHRVCPTLNQAPPHPQLQQTSWPWPWQEAAAEVGAHHPDRTREGGQATRCQQQLLRRRHHSAHLTHLYKGLLRASGVAPGVHGSDPDQIRSFQWKDETTTASCRNRVQHQPGIE